MRLARSLLFAFALTSAGGTALMVHRMARLPAGQAVPAKAQTVDILVAARAVAVGEMVGKEQVRWQPWPATALSAGSLRREAVRAATGLPFDPAPARFALMEGEPLSAPKLSTAENGSALALLVGPGMRAVSVPVREETSAGGFIQPGDRVDVIVTRRRGDAPREAARSEIVMRGARVLAVGKSLSGRASTLKTATLELTPSQAATIAAAQSGGDISLSLIGASDAARGDMARAAIGEASSDVRVMKFGRPTSRQATQ